MSDITAAIDIIWSGMQRNQHHPVALAHKLDLRSAYEVQLGLLARHEAQGERQAGWKVGLTSAAMRAQQKVHEPCFGFLLESGNKPSGCRIELGGLIQPGFENELCLTIGESLRGPGVSF